jgi:phosphoribosylformimino-5-aminoimidazole carboxamide ribotide isomerase
MMNLIPAIDIKNEKCVRLFKGDYSKETIYSDNPVEVSRGWCNDGAKLIHLVDLDGALEGTSTNHKVIEKIVKDTDCKFQVGGGIRTIETIDNYLSIGVRRVIIGTSAFTDKVFFEEACKTYGDRIAVGLDIKDGKIAIRGWNTKIDLSFEEALINFKKLQVSLIVLTSVDRDGTLEGFNEALIRKYLSISSIPVIISGGIKDSSDLDQIEHLNDERISGVILGKSLYENTINLRESIERYSVVS